MNHVNEFDHALSLVRAVENVLGALQGLPAEDQRAVLLQVRARLELSSTSASGQRRAITLVEQVRHVLSGAPKEGYSATEVAAKLPHLNASSVLSTLSEMARNEKVARSGEVMNYRYHRA